MSITIKQAINDFLLSCKVEGKSYGTIECYSDKIKGFLEQRAAIRQRLLTGQEAAQKRRYSEVEVKKSKSVPLSKAS